MENPDENNAGRPQWVKSELVETLGVDEATADKIAAELVSLSMERMEATKAQGQYMEELEKELEYSYPSEDKLKELLARIDAITAEIHDFRQKETEVLKKYLGTEQRARYLLLMKTRVESRRGRSRLLKGMEQDSDTGMRNERSGSMRSGQRPFMGGSRPPAR